MPIMTLQDRLVVIRSNLDSIDRAVKAQTPDAIATFFSSIASVASEGAELAQAQHEAAQDLKP
jgi:hypothetical protein